MGGVDLSLFQFDPFLSWSVFMMNGDKTIYGRYGTASPQTKRADLDSNPNHSSAGLAAALRRALELHSAYSQEPALWAGPLAGKTGPKPEWSYVAEFPTAQKYGRSFRVEDANESACTHCHEVQRSMIDSYFMTGKKLSDNMLWIYPDPSILGLSMSIDHCARVAAVADESIAAIAGLQPGDDLLSMASQPLLSIADVQWVLHNFPDAEGDLPILIRREGEEIELELSLPEQWRRAGDFGWRYRVAGYAMWLWMGVSLEDDPRGVRVPHLSPPWFKKPNLGAREKFRAGDLILELDGKSDWSRSSLLSYLMREKELGSMVHVKLERAGEAVELSFEIPSEQPEVLGY